MSRFFVGQPVRILWSKNWPELAGQEGIVTAIDVTTSDPDSVEAVDSVDVAPNCWASNYAPHSGRFGATRFSAVSGQLEPILPEGDKQIPAEMTVEELLPFLRELVPA